jgi:hypothetical protein
MISRRNSNRVSPGRCLECYRYISKLIYLYYLSEYLPAPDSFWILFLVSDSLVLLQLYTENNNKISSFFLRKCEIQILSVCVVCGCGYF